MEFRTASITPASTLKIEGYALVFCSTARIGDNHNEWIQRGALEEADLSDVPLFYNHCVNQVPLARTPDTLQLTIDERGLKFTAHLPDTADGRAVYESVKRGDLRGCSFAFTVADGGDEWIGDTRIINRISKIHECSICPFPAYKDTSVEARNQKGSFNMFSNVADSFNFYRTQDLGTIEKRAAEIETLLTGDNADAAALNIELEGMKAARANIEERAANVSAARANLKTIITGIGVDETFTPTEDVLSSAEYRAAFFKTLQGKDLGRHEQRAFSLAKSQLEKRAAEFSTSTNSAAVIPSTTLDEIIRKARKQGGLMAEARAFSVPSKIAIPIATPSTKASWHVEGATVDTEKVSPTTVNFDANEIIKIFSISAKVQTMSIAAFESYLVDELEACVMETISDALVNGTGSGQGTGLMSVFDSTNTVTAATAIDYSDVIAAMALLPRGYSAGAKWAMSSKTLYTVFYGMVDGNQRPIFISDPKVDGVGKIFGFDVIVDDFIPDGTVIFGNFAQYLGYNLPAGIVIETSRESSFRSGLIDYRALAIADCKPLVAEAFVKLTAPVV